MGQPPSLPLFPKPGSYPGSFLLLKLSSQLPSPMHSAQLLLSGAARCLVTGWPGSREGMWGTRMGGVGRKKGRSMVLGPESRCLPHQSCGEQLYGAIPNQGTILLGYLSFWASLLTQNLIFFFKLNLLG